MIEKGNDYEYATAAPDRYNLLKEFAKKNRKEMTRSETTLWNALRKLACGFRLRRQHPIGDFIADFICLERRLVIEVDGGYHSTPEQQNDDVIRTEFLEHRGFTVIRFTNDEVDRNLQTVLQKIKEQLLNI